MGLTGTCRTPGLTLSDMRSHRRVLSSVIQPDFHSKACSVEGKKMDAVKSGSRSPVRKEDIVIIQARGGNGG